MTEPLSSAMMEALLNDRRISTIADRVSARCLLQQVTRMTPREDWRYALPIAMSMVRTTGWQGKVSAEKLVVFVKERAPSFRESADLGVQNGINHEAEHMACAVQELRYELMGRWDE